MGMKPYLAEEKGIRNFGQKVNHYIVKWQNDFAGNSP